MALIKDFAAKLAQMKALVRMKVEAAARNSALHADRPAKALSDEDLAKGHPKVASSIDFRGVQYGVRLGTWFGWIWLAFTCLHGTFMFAGLAGGTVKMNGTLITQAHWWDFLFMGLIYVPFLLIGLAFSLARYRVTLSDEAFTVRWRILPYLGWTWTLPVGEGVAVTLAFRGSSDNKKPVESIVVTSLGKETHFGAFLPADVKEFLAGAIQHYYGEPVAVVVSTPFIPND
jgi:hypothetical protein